MATTKIVSEVTLEQLDALIASNSLNEGLQYNVTDKGWLLIATSQNTLSSIAESLLLINGTIMPNYIYSKNITVDTGIIDYNIDSATTNALQLIHPINYFVTSAELNAVCNGDSMITNIGVGSSFAIIDELAGKAGLIPISINHGNEFGISAVGVGNIDGNTLRVVVNFSKAYLI